MGNGFLWSEMLRLLLASDIPVCVWRGAEQTAVSDGLRKRAGMRHTAPHSSSRLLL